MPNINTSTAFQIIRKGVGNLIHKRPLAISLEITHSCNCNCEQCDKGGIIRNEELASPEYFQSLVKELNPLIAQISGGEPLLRKDVYDIIKKTKIYKTLPYMVLCTNGWLLTEENYFKLKEAGINEFSISLDFPDERHDRNRGIPGLYQHLSDLLPKLATYNHQDITLICVIRRESLPELHKMAQIALDWNVAINFSSYTPLRTDDHTKSISGSEALKQLRSQLDYLIQFKRETGRIFTTESVLNRYYEFFSNGSNIPNCRAGYRSLVVNPDGKLVPCAMQPYAYNSHKELIEQFSKQNTCGGCYVSLRANTEKSIRTLLKDSWLSYRLMNKTNTTHSPD